MAVPPLEYLVEALRIDLAHLKCSRIILIGSPSDPATEELRVGLARAGLQVLAPPEPVRAWIAALAEQPVAEASHDDLARLEALLADGLEHGAQAIVATSEQLAALIRSRHLDTPVLVPEPRGAVVAVEQVVFDMGGVLFRWEPLAMARRVCADENDAQLLADAVFGSQEWAWQDAGAVDEETVAWTSQMRLPRRLHPLVDELVFHWHEHRVCIDGMADLIADLKAAGYGIYLLSNAGTSFARYCDQLPAYALFDGEVVSCYEHVVKPDARIYRILLDRYGLDAERCLFVDDTQRNVLGARRVGMRSVLFEGDPAPLRAMLL